MSHKKLNICLYLLLITLGIGLFACGSFFNKEGKKDKSPSDDSRFPTDWDLKSDWASEGWEIKDL